jgi:glucose-6-phosphate isomerase
MPRIRDVRERMAAAAGRLRGGQWLGHSGRPIRRLVHVGIGGSDLGPRMACAALSFFSQGGPRIDFVSNLDPGQMGETLRSLAPEETLFILAPRPSPPRRPWPTPPAPATGCWAASRTERPWRATWSP